MPRGRDAGAGAARTTTSRCRSRTSGPCRETSAARRFEHQGVVTTFSKRDGRYLVRTDGPDGKLAEFDVAFLFGVTPLEQYLLELPGGRLQALGIAWDSRPKQEGGQRFFHLYPGERVPHSDVLHWTKPSQNWNSQCAECHSTNLRKGYSLATRSFETTYSELNVSCEACHGPASRHVQWALAAKARGRSPKGIPASWCDTTSGSSAAG